LGLIAVPSLRVSDPIRCGPEQYAAALAFVEAERQKLAARAAERAANAEEIRARIFKEAEAQHAVRRERLELHPWEAA
jgi:hypothetical protein